MESFLVKQPQFPWASYDIYGEMEIFQAQHAAATAAAAAVFAIIVCSWIDIIRLVLNHR